ncbi:SusC/RagA family TonB-linked outer membrane protein [Aestuariivivens marinum]|uniref:SusC/RagA family TonB-linked outer membrane protein n=1 Tax=Aestuariivivens marinum TaxID=2913555 RepID=UPI001F57AB9C|nr:SusC/RagA family TonB-linked outer membrane protein [Aestuariivivens marinum]
MKTKFSGMLALFLALVVQFAIAQEKTITGTVSDNSGLPLPGTTVLIKGTSTGTSTDFDGNYSIKANTGDVLVYSFVGYTTKEITIGSSSTINVTMQEDAAVLEEVVVTALGIKRQKRSLGYAATAIDDEQLTEVTTVNPLESLSGKVAGVDITAPNQPGASPRVILRGYTSLNGNGPLYVVDGTPISSSVNTGSVSGRTTDVNRSFDGGSNINDIDPNSIESINILKGGAATALYGSRAANGAIIITTKKGKADQKLTVEIKSSIDFLEVSRVPHLQYQFGQGWDGLGYSFTPAGTLGASNENGSWGPEFNGEIRTWGQIVNNSQLIKPYVALEDQMLDFFDIGNTYANTIRLSGGSDNSDFSLTFSRLDTDGVFPTDADALKKNTLSVNAGLSRDRFRVRIAANYAQTRQNAINTGQGDDAGQGATLVQELLQVPTDVSIIDMKDYLGNPFYGNDWFYTPYARNPYWVLNENATNVRRENLYGNINFQYDILSNLIGTFQLGTNIVNNGVHSHGAVVNFTPGSANDALGQNPIVGGVTELMSQRRQYEALLYFDYNTELSDDFGLEANLGGELRNSQFSSLDVTVTNLDVPNFYEISNSAVTPITEQNDSQLKNYSLFGSLTLNYKDRIYLNLTGRNEWASTLGIGNNSFFYPSANMSAIVVDNGQHFVKLRGGYSQLANSAAVYLTQSEAAQGENDGYFGKILYPFGGVNSFEIGRTLGNAGIKPEFTDEYEVGAEVALFNRRVTIDAAYYNKKTDGVITQLQLPPTTGYREIFGNYMDVENKGVELAVGLVPVRTDDFSWNIDYTFTKNKNEVTRLPEGSEKLLLNSAYSVSFYAIKGQPLGVFQALGPKTNDTGQIIVGDDGYPETTDEEVTLGDSQRDFVMGLQNTFKYKNFRLSFAFDWKEGGEMYSYTSRLLGFTGNSPATTYNDRLPFIIPNSVVDNGDGTYSENTTPVGFEDVGGYYNASNNPSTEATNHIIDKTFVRLRDASLSYSFPSNWIENTGISDLTVSLYGRNLFMWTPDENPYVDPEVTSFGGADLVTEFGEFAANPAQRTYGFSLKMTF